MMRTTMPGRAAAMLLAACLLQACGGVPVRPLAVQPLLRLEDGDGGNPDYAYQLGRHYERQGDLRQAGAAYARSIALAPQQLDGRNAQAVLLARQGELAAAAALLRQLVADFPGLAQPRSNLGYVYLLQGDRDAAKAALQQALALDPGHAQARANLALLDADNASVAAAASAAAPYPSATPAAMPAARMELVQLAPNEFRLQARTTTTPTAPIAHQADSGAIQIVNGNGVAGMGERVRRMLAGHGIVNASVVNQRGHYQRTTIIEYLPAQQQRARVMLAALQGRARLLPARALPGRLTLRLVLGHDHARDLAALVQIADTADTAATIADTDTAMLLALHSTPATPTNQE
ncbi:LytR C-terminal domain-containing protein [Rugamonas aquatica]|uniref:Tetratricopeptide repeat protein n=1 Tax=Rugamonas aquatica TaxID=2743357 RepID=A0A6A7N4E2_9BURK|nr:LytR C-terminal domain-containing protein [Rugamonas aquatica]MQA39896.1 tetratricopeptide repeat protein [Rugamonas aquatica]